ncbi:MAG: hypothetical protein M3Y86_13405 [Verrucomicrobiota bacterium]|nr:hypothetical protein [Verrucomicrobiota bacterium]
MKTILSLGVLLATPIAPLFADDLPKTQVFARYEPMMNHSPFAVATAVAPPPQAPNFAKDLYIANAAKLADEGVVTLASNVDRNMKEYLSTKGSNKSGYSISSIDWSDRVGATKVTIIKDGQSATLMFNQALLSQPVGGAPGQPAQTIPQPVQNVNQAYSAPPAYNNVNSIKPAPIPTLPTPPPRVRGVIQRNPNVPATPPPDDRANQ